MTILFLSVLGKLVYHYLIQLSLFQILPKDMTTESLDRQLQLVMVYVGICARVDIPIDCTKLTDVIMQNLAVAGVIVAHIGMVI